MSSLPQQSAAAHLPRPARAALTARAMPRSARLALVTEGSFAGVRHLDPFRIGRRIGDVAVVPVPPFVRPGLRIALRRVFPLLLAAERGHVEIGPDGTHRLVAAVVD